MASKFLSHTLLSFTMISSSLWAMEPEHDAKVLRYVTPSYRFEDIETMVQKQHPIEFEGSGALDLNVVKVHRLQIMTQPHRGEELPLSTHNPALEPLVGKLEQFLSVQSVYKPTDKILLAF